MLAISAKFVYSGEHGREHRTTRRYRYAATRTYKRQRDDNAGHPTTHITAWLNEGLATRLRLRRLFPELRTRILV